MEKIELNYYRCFTFLEIGFRKNVNLFIGDNSSGKSTIIQALKSVLNSFFIGFSDGNTTFSGLSKDDFTNLASETGYINEKPIVINFTFLNTEGALQLHSKKGRTLQKPLDDVYLLGKKYYNELFDKENKQVIPLPVFGSFSTKDIHTTKKTPPSGFRAYDHKPSFGYYDCLQGDGYLVHWTKRLLILREANRGNLEIDGVVNALIDALGENGCGILSKVEIRHNQGKVYYILMDGREVETENLSDGYKRLVNIIMDIAFRCMILNKGIYGVDACKQTTGTVLVDEIDLHLHPSLQALVIKGFKNAFPQVQLIATTHAPLIMSSVPNNEDNIVFKLEYSKVEDRNVEDRNVEDIENNIGDYSAKPINLYGLDVSTIMEIALHTVPRIKMVDDELKQLFDFIDNEQLEEAKQQLANLQSRLGEQFPDLAKAEAMLNFLS